MQRYKNLQVYNTLKSNGLKCYGIKTDSLLVDAKEEELKKIFNFDREIGGLKIECNKYLGDKTYKFTNNTLISNKTLDINEIYIKSESNFFQDK